MLSIIIPVFNNSSVLESNLPLLINELSIKKYDFEIIIVDDGSKNQLRTQKIAQYLGAFYIGLDKNRGKGAAIKEGMNIAKGEFRIFTDADIPYEFKSIESMISEFKTGKSDLIIGDRTLVKSEYYDRLSFIRNFGSKLFTLLVGSIFKKGLSDTQCGLKGFTADAAKYLFSKSIINGFAFDVEILYLANKYNYQIQRVPVKLRNQSSSSVRVLKHGISMLIDLFKIKINQILKLY